MDISKQELQEIFSIPNLGKLNKTQKQLWDNFLTTNQDELLEIMRRHNIKSHLELFSFLQQNPPILNSLINTDKTDRSVVDGALLKNLVDQMNQDRAQIEASLKQNSPQLTTQNISQLSQIIAQLQAQRLNRQANTQDKQTIANTIKQNYPKANTDPQADPLYQTKQFIAKIVEKATQDRQEFNQQATQTAIENLTLATVSGAFNPEKEEELALALEISLIQANSSYNPNSEIATLLTQIDKSFTTPTTQDLTTPPIKKEETYQDPTQDSDIQKLQQEITRQTNQLYKQWSGQNASGIWGQSAENQEAKKTWDKARTRVTQTLWTEFIQQHPIKALAYQDKIPELQEKADQIKASQPQNTTPIIFPATKTTINPTRIETILQHTNTALLNQELKKTAQTIKTDPDLKDTTQEIRKELNSILETTEASITPIAKKYIPTVFNYQKIIDFNPQAFKLFPHPEASKAFEIINPADPDLAQTILFYAQFNHQNNQGLTPTQLIQNYTEYRQNSDNPLTEAEQLQIQQTYTNLNKLINSPLQQEIISANQTTQIIVYKNPIARLYQKYVITPTVKYIALPIARLYQKYVITPTVKYIALPIAKTINSLPTPLGNTIKFLISPRMAIRNYLARKVGRKLALKLYKNFAKRVTNKFARKVAKTMLRKGIKAGLKFLLKEGVKSSLQALAQAANIAPGLGIAIGILIEIGDKLLKAIIAVGSIVMETIWGRKAKPEDAAGAVLLSANMGASTARAFFSALGSAITAITVATQSVATVILISSGVVIFLYLSIFTVGPIISALAQIGPFEPGALGLVQGSYTPDANDTYDDTTSNISCFSFNDDLYKWPDRFKIPTIQALKQLQNTQGDYFNKVCTGDNIKLQFGGNNGAVGGKVMGLGKFMIIYTAGTNLYTLAHESGHVFAHRHDEILQKFSNDIGVLSEGYLDSYPATPTTSEDFAETIATYIAKQSIINRYPKHKQFALLNIF